MRIRVSAIEFKDCLKKLVQSTAGTCINLTTENDKLYIQSSVGVIIEREIDYMDAGDVGANEPNAADKISISVVIDKDSTTLISQDQRFVYLTQVGDLLFIQQDGVQVVLSEQPEDRVFLEDTSSDAYTQIGVSEFSKVLRVGRVMAPVAKALATSESPIIISGGNCYITYTNMAYVCETGLPDMQVSYDLLKKAMDAVTGNTVSYFLDREHGILWLRGDGYRISVPVTEVYQGSIEEVNTIDSSLTYLTELNLASYTDSMMGLCTMKKTGMYSITVGHNHLHLNAASNTARFDVGPEVKEGEMIQLSVAQLAALFALYGDCTEVRVRRGTNLICMMSEKLKSKLLLAGLTCTVS